MAVGYQIDTGQARTDLYGIGKGEAQVLDLSPSRENAANEERMNFARKQVKTKQEADRENDIYSNLGDLDKIAIYAGHRPDFAAKQQELMDYTRKNIGKIKQGDPDAIMGFQNLYSGIRTNAELSKNFREQKEKYALEILKDPTAYREESIDYFNNSGRDDNGEISYELDPSKIKKNIDLQNDFRTNVRPIIEDMAKGKSYSYTDSQGNESSMDINNFDEKHATVLLHDQLKRKVIAEQAAHDFNVLPQEDQAKYTDYMDYYVKKLLPLAIVDQNKTVVKRGDQKEYAFKNGTWTNDNYAWTYNQGEITKDAKPAPGFKEGDKYQEISLSNRKSEADNKPVSLTQANGETIFGIPKGIIKKEGWDNWQVAVAQVDKKTGKPTIDKGKEKISYVPVHNNTAKIEGEYGFKVNDAIKSVDKNQAEDVVVITTQEAYDALPKGTKYKDSKGTMATKK